MNKRGMIATVLIIILVVPIIILVQSMSDSARQAHSNIANTEGGTKAVYYYDDIIDDFKDLNGLLLNTQLAPDGTLWVNFSDIGTLNAQIQAQLQDYAGFIRGTYGPLVNLDLNVTNPPFVINLSLHQYHLVVGDELYLTTGDDVSEQWRNLAEVYFALKVNQSINNRTGNDAPVNNGQIKVEVHIADWDDNELLDKTVAMMKPNGANQAFSVEFDDGCSIAVNVEKLNTSDGTVYTTTNCLQVNVTELAVRFLDPDVSPELVSSAEVQIGQPDNINKSQNVIILSDTDD